MKISINEFDKCLANYLIFDNDVIYDINDSVLDKTILRPEFILFFNEYVANLVEKRILDFQQLTNVYQIIQYLSRKIYTMPNINKQDVNAFWENLINQFNEYKGFGNVKFYIEQMKIRNSDDADLKRIINLRKQGIALNITSFNYLRKNVCDSMRNDYIFLIVLLENSETTIIDVRQLFDSKDINTVNQLFASLNAIGLINKEIFKDESVKDRIKMIIYYIRKNHTALELNKVLKLIKVYKGRVK